VTRDPPNMAYFGNGVIHFIFQFINDALSTEVIKGRKKA
jgi:hypothetical protein